VVPDDSDTPMMEAGGPRVPGWDVACQGEESDKLQLETDSEVLAKMWTMGSFQRSYLAPVFSEITLMYASRSCNHVVHLLAK
jgi:hypothetical protein